MVKRNDKVYLLEPYTSSPKMSHQVKMPVGKLLIIKRMFDKDEFCPEEYASVEVKGKVKEWLCPVPAERLFKYTRIGELLYG